MADREKQPEQQQKLSEATKAQLWKQYGETCRDARYIFRNREERRD